MDETDTNPFADPEISTSLYVAVSAPKQQRGPSQGSNDNDPFTQVNLPTTPAVLEESPVEPIKEPPKVDMSSLQKRQEELEKKAAELKLREESLRVQSSGADRTNNFPPFPKWCPCGPCFYQDIGVDIPVEFQTLVKLTFWLFLAHILILFLNIVGGVAFLTASKGSAGLTFGLSIVWFIILPPLNFIFWFRPLYKAFRSDSSFSFFFFFLTSLIKIIVDITMCIGITGYTVGFVNGLQRINDGHKAVGVIMVIIGVTFLILAVLCILLLVKVHSIYRHTDASFQKAQREFAEGALRREILDRDSLGNPVA